MTAHRLNVLSLNIYILGHITYQQTLEREFAEHHPEIDFRSLRLTEETGPDAVGRAVYSLGTRRLPGCEGGDRDFYRLRAELILSWMAARALRRRLREHRPDVVHLHTRSVALHARGACDGVPFVIDTDTTTAALARHRAGQPAYSYRPLIRREREAFARARRVIAWSEHTRRSLLEDYGVPAEKVVCIHPGVALDGFARIARDGVPRAGKPRILFVGNDFQRKGGGDLLSVWTETLSDRCDLDVVTNTPEPLPERPGLRVHRSLQPQSGELRELFAAADVFALPSHEDTFPLALIEAMGAGLPCVATRVFGVPEMVADGENGFTVEPRDRAALAARLGELVGDPALRRRFGDEGRRRALRDFHPGTNVERMVEVFAEAARG